jgi:hypothetical protein
LANHAKAIPIRYTGVLSMNGKFCMEEKKSSIGKEIEKTLKLWKTLHE